MTLPDRARVVIIGGGVGGTSIAYHLTQRGWRDVVLLERSQLTSGSTFHSAGLVGQLRSTMPLTRLMMDSVALYGRLKDETGVDVGWRPVGSLRLASSTERMEELERQAGWGTSFGLPLELVSAAEAQRRFPLMASDGLIGAAFLPTDGYLDPSGLALALAEGARRGGARICEGVRVTGLNLAHGRIRGLVTDHGAIETEVVVNAGGIYAPEIGAMAGVTVPIIPMAHQYLVARIADPIPEDLPTMRDPDLLVYFRRDAGGLVMGGYERDPAPWGLAGIASDFNNRLLPEDWPRFMPLSQNAITRVPALEKGDVVKLINGPEAFTPDNEFLLGESTVRGFYVAAGFCAHGIAGAGGMGAAMAEWIIDGEPSLDLWKMDLRRFGAQYRSQAYTEPSRSTRRTTTSTIPTRSARRAGRSASPPPTHDSRSLAPALARSRVGSDPTGSSQTPADCLPGLRARVRVGAVQPDGLLTTGHQPSPRNISRPGSEPGSSMRPHSPRSKFQVRARWAFFNGCATTTWIVRRGASPTRRCSTGAAGSNVISR